jgi:hypothetical protein
MKHKNLPSNSNSSKKDSISSKSCSEEPGLFEEGFISELYFRKTQEITDDYFEKLMSYFFRKSFRILNKSK